MSCTVECSNRIHCIVAFNEYVNVNDVKCVKSTSKKITYGGQQAYVCVPVTSASRVDVHPLGQGGGCVVYNVADMQESSKGFPTINPVSELSGLMGYAIHVCWRQDDMAASWSDMRDSVNKLSIAKRKRGDCLVGIGESANINRVYVVTAPEHT